MERTEFVLTRHTSTDWDESGKLKGQTDVSLNEKGLEEAQNLAEKVFSLSKNFTIIVSSDLKRAVQTAEVLNSKLNLPMRLDRRLRETSFGSLEGKTTKEIVAEYGESILRDLNDQHQSYDFKPFGGESRDGVLKRHIELLKEIKKSNPDKVVLIVGHYRGFSTLLAGLGVDPNVEASYRTIKY